MVAGVILSALGLKKVLESVSDTSHHELSEPLAALPLVAMYAGVALYLLAHVAFRFRIWRHISVQRVIAALLLLALIPAAAQVPALASLAFATAVLVGLIAYESTTRSEFRERVRHEVEP
jgi:low temperature requirement protein LtrA